MSDVGKANSLEGAPVVILSLTWDSLLYRVLSATPIMQRVDVLRRLAEGYLELKASGANLLAGHLSLQHVSGLTLRRRIRVKVEFDQNLQLDQLFRDMPNGRRISALRSMAEDCLAYQQSERVSGVNHAGGSNVAGEVDGEQVAGSAQKNTVPAQVTPNVGSKLAMLGMQGMDF